MKSLKNFFFKPLIKKSVLSFLFVLTFSLIFFALRWSKLPPQIPLYYSLPWGRQQLASPWELTILPVLAVSVFATNLLFAFFLLKDDDLLTKIAIFSGLFVSALLFYAFFRIIILVS